MKVIVPKVTIAIPTFNRAGLLRSCLKNIINFAGPEVEVVVSNNASTDDTSVVMDEFDSIFLVKNHNRENVGLFGNLNKCLEIARSEYIIFLSDDDIIAADLIPTCVSMLSNKNVLAAIVANNEIIKYSDGSIIMKDIESHLDTGVYSGDFLIEQLWTGKVSFQLCGVMFRCADLKQIGGFPAAHSYAGDIRTYAELFFGQLVAFEASPKCTYVVHNRSETFALGRQYRLRDVSDVFNEIIAIAHQRLPRRRANQIEKVASLYVTRVYVSEYSSLYDEGTIKATLLANVFLFLPWAIRGGGQSSRLFLRFLVKVALLRWSVRQFERFCRDLRRN